jgi:hypothetical protein
MGSVICLLLRPGKRFCGQVAAFVVGPELGCGSREHARSGLRVNVCKQANFRQAPKRPNASATPSNLGCEVFVRATHMVQHDCRQKKEEIRSYERKAGDTS